MSTNTSGKDSTWLTTKDAKPEHWGHSLDSLYHGPRHVLQRDLKSDLTSNFCSNFSFHCARVCTGEEREATLDKQPVLRRHVDRNLSTKLYFVKLGLFSDPSSTRFRSRHLTHVGRHLTSTFSHRRWCLGRDCASCTPPVVEVRSIVQSVGVHRVRSLALGLAGYQFTGRCWDANLKAPPPRSLARHRASVRLSRTFCLALLAHHEPDHDDADFADVHSEGEGPVFTLALIFVELRDVLQQTRVYNGWLQPWKELASAVHSVSTLRFLPAASASSPLACLRRLQRFLQQIWEWAETASETVSNGADSVRDSSDDL